MKMRIAIFLVIMVFYLLLVGCSEYSIIDEESAPGTGLLLTPEAARSIYYEVIAAQTEKYPTETDTEGNNIVFWTAGGSVWHKSRHCGSITTSNELFEGSEADAVAAGKSRKCSICGGTSE